MGLFVVYREKSLRVSINDLIHTYQTIASLGFGVALFFALVGSWRGWYFWKREVDILYLRIADLEKRINFLEEEKELYKQAATLGRDVGNRAAGVLGATA